MAHAGRRRPLTALTGMLTALTALVACVGCATAGGVPPTPAAPAAPAVGPASGVPRPDHVVVVVFENKDVDQVIGRIDARYLTSLAGQGADFTDAHAETHPSQPNYLALFSGSTQGVVDDSCMPPTDAPNLGGQLLAAGLSFVGYSEGLPQVGYTGCTDGRYASKHSPWVDFDSVPAAANRPLTDLPSDYADLPTVAFVTPDLCHDMHDCSVAEGDAWARKNLDGYVSWARDHNSLLLVTFDESESQTGDNGIGTFLVGPMVASGRYGERVDHYRLLRTVQAMYGLPPLGHSGDAPPITDVWR